MYDVHIFQDINYNSNDNIINVVRGLFYLMLKYSTENWVVNF